MATLGSNSAFFNENEFGGTNLTDGITGIKVSDGDTTAKVLFNKSSDQGHAFVVQSVSAKIDGITYEMDIAAGYSGSVIAVQNANRESTQFTFVSGSSNLITTASVKRHGAISLSATQMATLSAQGFNSVGPTLRRLYQMGYV